jgi:Uma2 family endonuclease
MSIERVVLTYENYAALPDDGRRYEIHDGELSVTPAPGTQHQRVSRDLLGILDRHVKERGLGEALDAPLDVILANTTIVQPDLVYVDPGRARFVTPRGIEGPPTLVIEIISPTTSRIDRVTKLQLYARYAIPYYWIVDQDARTIEAYALAEGGYWLITTARGTERAALAPFPDLALVPDSLFPA